MNILGLISQLIGIKTLRLTIYIYIYMIEKNLPKLIRICLVKLKPHLIRIRLVLD